MKKSKSTLVLALLTVALMATSAQAAGVFLSEVTAVGGGVAPGNPEITVEVGATIELAVWVKMDTGEAAMIALPLGVEQTGTQVTATGHTVTNPSWWGGNGFRWEQSPGNPDDGALNAGGQLVDESLGVCVTESGMADWLVGNDPMCEAATGGAYFLHSHLTLQAVGLGTTDIFLVIDGGTANNAIAFSGESGTHDVQFGTGDDPLDRSTLNTRSTGYEARINVIPEPATLALFGIGGLMMARRRRR